MRGKCHLKNHNQITNGDPIFAEHLRNKSSLNQKARLIGEELSRVEGVLAIVLFGSTAKGTDTPESDLDLLIVTEREMENQLNKPLYDLMFRYDAPVEGLFLTYQELLMSIQEKNAIALGIFEGYQILYDKIGLEGLFSFQKKQIEEEWTYDNETGTWMRRNLMPSLKPQKHKRET
jgi:predicted nucleotidyltransferase